MTRIEWYRVYYSDNETTINSVVSLDVNEAVEWYRKVKIPNSVAPDAYVGVTDEEIINEILVTKNGWLIPH